MNEANEELKNNLNRPSCLVLGGTEGNPQEWKKIIHRELYERSEKVKEGKQVTKSAKVKEAQKTKAHVEGYEATPS